MSKFITFRLASFLALLPTTLLADWATVDPVLINIWPNGTVGLSISSGIDLPNNCGTVNPFLIWPPYYGVTSQGANAMLATLMMGKAMGKSVDVHYFPLDSCKVDSLSFNAG